MTEAGDAPGTSFLPVVILPGPALDGGPPIGVPGAPPTLSKIHNQLYASQHPNDKQKP